MSSHDRSGEDGDWEHLLVRLQPVELAPLQRRYIAELPNPTLTDLDLRLRDGIYSVGVKVAGETVAFALIQPTPPGDLPGPLLVALGAPGQSSADLLAFFQEVVAREGIRGVWGRSDDVLLLEALMLEGWHFSPAGPLLVLDELVAPEPVEGIEVRHLAPGDLEAVMAFRARVPEAGELDRGSVRKQLQDRVLDGLYEGGVLRALAELLPQHHPSYVSLRILVEPAGRRRGFGVRLAAEVVREELEAGRQVVAAFSSREPISRRLVEALGARVAALYYVATPPENDRL